MPSAIEVETDFMPSARLRHAILLNKKYRAEFFQQFLSRVFVEIFQDPMIWQNLQMGVGKNHRQELRAATRPAPVLVDSRGSGASMMAIGNVQNRRAQKR